MIECPRCGKKEGKGGKYRYILCHDCMLDLDDAVWKIKNFPLADNSLDNDEDEWDYEASMKRKRLIEDVIKWIFTISASFLISLAIFKLFGVL